MKKLLLTLSIAIGLGISANAQIQSLAGPRIGLVYISSSITSGFLDGKVPLFDDKMPENYTDEKGTITSLYGWQWESRFADAGNVTGIVEWIVLAAGMERGKFLPSVSSMVGARTESGLEFAVGPNLSLGGIAMVFGVGYNFKSGDLNMPVNIAFVPGRTETQESSLDNVGVEVDYHTGNRFSITVGFNLTK